MTVPVLSNVMLRFILEEAAAGRPVSLHVQVDHDLPPAELAAAVILLSSTPGVTKVGATPLVQSEPRIKLGLLKSAGLR